MVKEKPKLESLEELAERIVQYSEEADHRIIQAGKLICLARERVETELAGQTTWTEWARENIKLSESRLRELQRIAEAEDPQKELERQRELTQKRVENYRQRQKAKQAGPLQGADDKSVKAPPNLEMGQQVSSKADSEAGNSHLEERANEPPLRNGGDGASVADPEGGDHRERLIKWAEDAPSEEIETVWAFVQSLDRAPSGSEIEEVAESAAA